MTQQLERGSKFLNWFWDLADEDDTRRCLAGTMIVKYLLESTNNTQQSTIENNKKGSYQKGSESQGLSADGEYAWKRLVRGLPSSRECARLGFSTCLCEMLTKFPTISIDQTLSLLDDSTKVMLYVL
jgi:DNA polymerase phi